MPLWAAEWLHTPYHQHTDVNMPSSTHTHRRHHPMAITQTSPQHHCHTDISTTSLPHRHQHNFPHVPHATLSCIVVVKLNMWGYHGLSGPFFGLCSWLNFNFHIFSHCLTTRHHTRPGAQSFAAVSLSSASLSCGSTLGRPPRAKDMVRAMSGIQSETAQMAA